LRHGRQKRKGAASCDGRWGKAMKARAGRQLRADTGDVGQGMIDIAHPETSLCNAKCLVRFPCQAAASTLTLKWGISAT
jgi:hypothetical protein